MPKMTKSYGKFFKSVHFLLRIYTKFQRLTCGTRAFRPIRTIFFLTRQCNCKCYMCSTSDLIGNISEELTITDILPVISALPRGSSVVFTGGEPFLAKDFLTIVKETAKNYKIQIQTNGWALDKKMLYQLVEAGVWLITMGIDAPLDHVQDGIRRKDGLLQKQIKVIRELTEIKRAKKSQLPFIQINTAILKETIPFLPQMVELAKELMVDGISLGPDNRLTRSSHLADYQNIDINLLRDSLEKSLALGKRYKLHLRLSNNLTVEDILNIYSNNSSDMSHFACYAPWAFLYILPDGTATICNLNFIGNIKKDNIKTIWNNHIARQWRKSFMNRKNLPESCLACCNIWRI